MIKNFLLLISGSIVFSCVEKSDEKRGVGSNELITPLSEDSLAIGKEIIIYSNEFTHPYTTDSFSYSVLLKDGYVVKNRELIQNKYTNLNDTLIVLSKSESKISFYFGANISRMVEIDLKDSKYAFGGFLRIGIDSYEVLNHLKSNVKLKSMNFVIKLIDEETGGTTNLFFKNRKLKRILSDWYFE